MKYTLHKLHNPARGRWRCKLIIGALLLSLVLGTVMGVWVSAETDATATVLNFKDPAASSVDDVVIPQGEVVASLLGEIPDEEVAYLNTHSGYALVTSAIPKDKMLVHVLDDGLSVIAYAYSYTTAEGATVMWLPFAAENTAYPAEVSLLDYDMDLDLYRGTLPGSKGDTVEIYYTASFILPQDTALSMINEGYFAAEHLVEKMQDYEAQYALWLPKHEQYTAYVTELAAWELQKTLYDAYCEEQAAFDAWWQDHDEKEVAMNAYLAQKSAFETWEQYKKDLAAYEAYMELVHATPELKQEYEAQMTVAFSQLNLMNRMFIKSELASGKPASFADVLGGGPADFILSNQTMLKQIEGVDSEDVDRCVRATFALRRLILGKKDENGNTLSVGYQELTEHEAQYTFYIENREELVFYLNDLYDAMMALGSVEYVQKELDDRGAMVAFKNFLANLYVQSRLMDDTLELDRDLTYLDTPLYEMVEEELVWEDTFDTYPLEVYPQPPFTSDDVPPVEYPGEAPPEAQDPGDAPAPVPDPEYAPEEPTPVEDPGNPPAVVPDPGEAPMAPNMTEEERGLYELARENGLMQRTEADMTYGSTVYVTQRGAVSAVSGKRFTVTVMNHEGKLLQSRNLVFGTRFLDVFTPPTVNMGDGTVYTFVGWSLEKTPLPQNKEQRFHTISIDDVVMAMELYPVYVMCHHPGDAATCTEDQTCTVCGEILTPALGHDYEATVTPPTCTEGGYTTHICSRCKDTYTDTPTDKLDHTEGDAATCTEDQTCTACGEILTPALGHDYEATVTDPTCTEDGYTTHTCSRCKDTYTDTPTEKLGHTAGNEATCTEDQTCTACGEVLTPALGHDYEATVTDPTCTEGGYTTHTCSRCKDTYTDTTTEKLDHTEGNAATCTEDQTCTVCGEILTPALGHDYDAIVTEPTCTEDGYTTHTCSRCEDTYTDTPTDKLGHTEGNEPTCTGDQTCTVCGEILTPALGHDYEATVTAPTCTEGGYTTHTCSRCEDTYTDTPTEKLGHTAGDEATCTEDQTCTVCGEVLTPALGHDYEATVTPPTCTEDGYTTHTCSRCKDTYTDTPTEAKGHTYGDWVIDLEAAPGVEGHKYAECERCGHRKEETIEALPPQTEETESESDDTQTEPSDETETSGKDPEKDTEIVTDEETQGTTATDKAETESDSTSAPILATPEVKWYAKILGAVGLPSLVLIAGAVIGGGAAGITILVMRASRKKREKR